MPTDIQLYYNIHTVYSALAYISISLKPLMSDHIAGRQLIEMEI